MQKSMSLKYEPSSEPLRMSLAPPLSSQFGTNHSAQISGILGQILALACAIFQAKVDRTLCVVPFRLRSAHLNFLLLDCHLSLHPPSEWQKIPVVETLLLCHRSPDSGVLQYKSRGLKKAI